MKQLKASLMLAALLTLGASFNLKAQMGGYGIFKFVNLAPSSRVAALGGTVVAVKDKDVTLAIQNPALLNREMDKQIALSYIDYMAGINFGSAVFARQIDKWGGLTAMGGLQYISYGTFVRADVNGTKLGTFTAGEYNFFAGAARQWKRFSYGTQLKFIYSQMESYRSTGLALDLGGAYTDTTHGFTAGLVIRNAGIQLSTYAGTREPMPFEIQAGVSFKPRHMPVRLNLAFTNLNRPDYTYINTNKKAKIDFGTGQEIVETIPLSEKIARHVIIGTELLLSKNLSFRFGYNHQRRKEMQLEGARGMVGYNFGVGFRINRFHVSYGRSIYHLAGGSNTFSLILNPNDFRRKAAPAPAAN